MSDDEDLLRWEYVLVARSDLLWASSVQPLILGADLIWDRAAAAIETEHEIYQFDEDGMLANAGVPLTGQQVSQLLDGGLHRIALMLLGLAIENVSKAILVRRQPSLVSDGGQFTLKTHLLADLVAKCGLEISVAETKQLQVLTDYVIWSGRYPVPLSAVGKGSPVSAQGAWVPARMGDPRETWKVGRAVFDRLGAALL